MAELSTFACPKTINRLDYVAVRLREGNYQVIKCNVSVDGYLTPKKNEVINPTYHNSLLPACKLGYLVLDAVGAELEVDEYEKVIV